VSLKFCPTCGEKLEDDSKFCMSCGADLKTQTQTPGSVPVQKISAKKTVTPEGVVYADFWPRFWAIVLDGIIIGIIGSSISWMIFPYNIIDPWGVAFNWLNNLISYIIGFIYFWGLESYNNGQTLGKMAMKLRTVDSNTFLVADPGKNAINSLAKPSGLLILDLIIGLISNSGDPQKRIRILQSISETAVIVVK